MADVLHVPRQPDGQSYYQSSNLRRSPPSTSALFLDASPAASPPPTSKNVISTPPPSSISSSPHTSAADLADQIMLSPPPVTSGLSLENKYSKDSDFSFPNYDDIQLLHETRPLDAPPSSPAQFEDVPDEDPVESTTTDTTRSDSPLATPTVSDDTAIKQEPSRHVDYLSHDWREEDIWSSWRHIVSQRKVYGQRSRLENASWRTWAKSKYHLRTISPETLNWLKESDVTWLYGPLQPAQSHPLSSGTSEPTSRLSKSNSFIGHKKPILKKRSMSEVMLQKSISTSSLLKQAAESVQAQVTDRGGRPFPDRVASDFLPPPLECPSELPSRDDYFSSSRDSSSPGTTPCDCQPKRHIRFDETVEQCIAVECKDGDVEDDADSSEEDEHHRPGSAMSDSSDDGVVMMKRKKRPALTPKRTRSGNSSRSNSQNGRKMIETLPASTLKYRTDSPDIIAQSPSPSQYTFGSGWTNSSLSPSPSSETLRPSNPSKNFLLGAEKHEEEAEATSWSFGANNARSSLGASASNEDLPFSAVSAKARKASSLTTPDDNGVDPEGMRRTPSGMFMPYEEDEDDLVAAGLFGRVSETINTAKDIAHVIWNVGWRK